MIIELGLLLWFGAKYMKRRLDELDVVNEKPMRFQRPLLPPTTINNYFAVKVDKAELRITRDMTDRSIEPRDYY